MSMIGMWLTLQESVVVVEFGIWQESHVNMGLQQFIRIWRGLRIMYMHVIERMPMWLHTRRWLPYCLAKMNGLKPTNPPLLLQLCTSLQAGQEPKKSSCYLDSPEDSLPFHKQEFRMKLLQKVIFWWFLWIILEIIKFTNQDENLLDTMGLVFWCLLYVCDDISYQSSSFYMVMDVLLLEFYGWYIHVILNMLSSYLKPEIQY